MLDLHYIQVEILKKLKYAPSLAFHDLQENTGIESNKIDFHIKQLIRHKLVRKNEGEYSLTLTGKNFINSLDFSTVSMEPQGLILVWLICKRVNDNLPEILIYTRKQHPYFGCQGFPAGKIKKGETIKQSAERELNEECGLKGTAEIKGLFHYLAYSKQTEKLVMDQYMYICLFKEPLGDIVDSDEGHYEWVKKSDVKEALKKPFSKVEDYLTSLDIVEGKEFVFKEITDVTGDY